MVSIFSIIFGFVLPLLSMVAASPLALQRCPPKFRLLADGTRPIRVSGTFASLTSGTIAEFHLDGSSLMLDAPPEYSAMVYSTFAPTGGCDHSKGPLAMSSRMSSTSNKCAQNVGFSLRALGGPRMREYLMFKETGAFFQCPTGEEIQWSTSALSGCTALTLLVVPV